MINGGVRVEGLNKLTRSLTQLGLEVEDLKEAFGPIAAEGARSAAGFAPRRSGNLQATIRGNRAKNKATVMAGKGRIKYAGPINYGWFRRHIKPSAFMQKADAEMQPKALSMLEKAIDDKIRDKGLA